MSYQTTFERETPNGDLMYIEVEYNIDPGEKGIRWGDPGGWTPDYPPSIEVTSCRVDGIETDLELTPEEEKHIWDEVSRHDRALEEDIAVERYEARRHEF